MKSPDELQTILTIAEKYNIGITFSPARKVAHFKDKNRWMSAVLYVEDGELWVNFDSILMTGNDPVYEFVDTFKNWATGSEW